MNLTTEQQAVKDRLLEVILSKDKQRVIVSGQAGTGKSTILKEVLDELECINALNEMLDGTRQEVILTATTHKAKTALQGITGRYVQTIHSLLGITPKRYHTTFKFTKEIIVIDECSFIDEKLYKAIDTALDCTVIFMGDEAQLPPVGSDYSYVFSLGLETLNLTKPIRQKSDDIANICSAFRGYILKEHNNFPKINKSDDLVYLDRKEFKKHLLKNQPYENNPVLCYTNRKAHHYNRSRFIEVFGRDYLEVGDEVYTLKEFRNIPYGLKVRIVDIQDYHMDISYNGGELFQRIKPDDGIGTAYALTTHKAQGSTYDSVYIDLSDFRYVEHLTQLARLLYVAISRARYKVYFTGDFV